MEPPCEGALSAVKRERRQPNRSEWAQITSRRPVLKRVPPPVDRWREQDGPGSHRWHVHMVKPSSVEPEISQKPSVKE